MGAPIWRGQRAIKRSPQSSTVVFHLTCACGHSRRHPLPRLWYCLYDSGAVFQPFGCVSCCALSKTLGGCKPLLAPPIWTQTRMVFQQSLYVPDQH